MPSLARINVTPVKGTTLHHPERVELTPEGIPGNRRFYLIGDRSELFSGPAFGPLVRIRADHDHAAETLTLRFPDGIEVAGSTDELGEAVTTDFFGRPVRSHVVEGPFSDALSAYVGMPMRLARTDRDGDGADVEPLTMVSFASVNDLAERGKHDGVLDARRFRINLELDGCAPYEEDSWDGRLVRVGDATLRLVGQIPRCLVTTQGPDTGVRDWDTLKQIAKQRPRIEGHGGLPFGMYARVVQPGAASFGDRVEPLT
jgi:MOSC domain-containing protein